MLPNIHTKTCIRNKRDALLFLRAYSIPLFILVTTAAIVVYYNVFALSVLGNGAPFPLFCLLSPRSPPVPPVGGGSIELHTPLPLVPESLRVFLFLFSNLLFTLMYVSFFRAVFTAPGTVDHAVWCHPPRSNVQEQQRQGHTWASQQDWIETQRRFAAVMAQYRTAAPAGGGAATEDVAVGGLQEMERMAAEVVAAEMAQKRAAQQLITVECAIAEQHLPTGSSTSAGGGGSSKHTSVGVHSELDPLQQPQQQSEPNPNVVLQFEADGRCRFCPRCDQYKPDNAHHCRMCGRCTLDMDHHCHFLNNCVGRNNYKYFLLLIAYAFLCGTLNTALMLYAFCVANRPWLQGRSFERRVRLSWLWLAAAMLAYALFTGYLLAYHLVLLYNGRATLDHMTATSAEALLIQQGFPVQHGLRPCLSHVVCRRPLLQLKEAERRKEEREWRERRRARSAVVFGNGGSLVYHALPLAPRRGPATASGTVSKQEFV